MEATQSLSTEDQSTSAMRVGISGEFIAYAGLILVAIVLRIAQLDVVPMTLAESREALAAWRVVSPTASGSPIVSESPLLFFLHSLAFTTLGASEFTARIWTALGGVALILTPLLFRNVLGRARAFICSLLLAFSPILLITSRTDSPVVWTLIGGVLALWALYRYYHTGRDSYALLLITLAVSVVLLTEPAGFVFALILLGAGLIAYSLTPSDSFGEVELPQTDQPNQLRERLQTWPWLNSLLVAIVSVVLVSTLFMLYPQGLSAVGELLGAGGRGITSPAPDLPRFFPLLVTIFYEPVLVILAIVGCVWLIRHDSFTFIERFFAGWTIMGLVASLVYAAAGAEHALWLLIPFTGLASSVIVSLMVRGEHPSWWNVPGWSRWVIAICGVFLLAMLSVHAQALGRALINMPEGVVQFGTVNSASLVLVLISVMSMVIGFFLASSLWGLEATAQGALLALLGFGLVTSLASGWRAAVVTAENPVELWNREAVSTDTILLRSTLTELSRRETGGYPQVEIVVLAPEDGVVAWLLRDYVNARFINNVSESRMQEIVLLPLYNESPNLGGSYVGQTFVISKAWQPASLQLTDLLSWWLAQRSRTPSVASDTMVLWLRQDIYNGVPSDAIANG